METNENKTDYKELICPYKDCPFIEKKYSNNKTCIYLQKNGSYTYCSGKYKVGRYKCTLLNETFSNKTFDNRIRCFHTLGPMPEEVYEDYKKGHTLGDLAAKYSLTIAMVRSRLKRVGEVPPSSNNFQAVSSSSSRRMEEKER
ncbi:MAG: hypothetical protein SPJ08_00525 [Sphaerochaetaceae bacterium]|nr:hypothetical protein [Sphaerochaetaceae bacterium]